MALSETSGSPDIYNPTLPNMETTRGILDLSLLRLYGGVLDARSWVTVSREMNPLRGSRSKVRA